MLPKSLVAARKLLEEITPLQTDCGLVCGGACCQTHPGEDAAVSGRGGNVSRRKRLYARGFAARDDSRLRGALQPRESSAGVPNVSAGDAPAPRWRENRDGCGCAIGLSAGTAGEKRPFAGFCRGSASGGESACAGRSAGGAFAAFDGHAGRIKGASGAVSREEGTCLRR